MKNLFTKNLKFLFILLPLTGLACGDGFKSSAHSQHKTSTTGGDDDNSNNNGGSGGGTTHELPNLDGKVDGGIWSGKEIVSLDWQNMDLLLKLPLDLDVGIVAGSVAIPQFEDITLEMVTVNGAHQLQVRVPLARLLGKHDTFTDKGLPNGDPLPMVTAGVLPRVDTKIGSQDVYFYLGDGTIAVFVPTKFNPFISLVFPVKNAKGEALGYFATIAKKGSFKGGFYASIQLPKEFMDQIGDLLP